MFLIKRTRPFWSRHGAKVRCTPCTYPWIGRPEQQLNEIIVWTENKSLPHQQAEYQTGENPMERRPAWKMDSKLVIMSLARTGHQYYQTLICGIRGLWHNVCLTNGNTVASITYVNLSPLSPGRMVGFRLDDRLVAPTSLERRNGSRVTVRSRPCI